MPKIEKKRLKTAKELGKEMNLSERTVRRYLGETRVNFEGRAKERREQAYQLRVVEEKSWEEVGKIMGVSPDSVKGLVKRYRAAMK